MAPANGCASGPENREPSWSRLVSMHGVVVGRPELEQHGAVVEPVDVLARAGGLSERDEAHQGGHEAPLPRAHRSLRLSLRHQPLRFGSDHVNEKSMANTSPMS